LLPEEWERGGEVLWFQDFFPRGASLSSSSAAVAAPFANVLRDLLRRMGISQTNRLFDRFDFSQTLAKLILSVPGTFSGEDLCRYGHMNLRETIAELSRQQQQQQRSAQEDVHSEYFYQCSSIGRLNGWLNEFRTSARGINVATGASAKRKRQDQNDGDGVNVTQSVPFYIVYPSRTTAVRSDPLLLPAFWFRRQDYSESVRTLFRDAVVAPQRRAHLGNSLMHSKILLCVSRRTRSRETDHSTAPARTFGWALVGSHNLSASAWGSLVGAGRSSLRIYNYELSVLLPYDESSNSDMVSTLELPFEFPPPPYAATDEPHFSQ
jgi:hypothetical protein